MIVAGEHQPGGLAFGLHRCTSNLKVILQVVGTAAFRCDNDDVFLLFAVCCLLLTVHCLLFAVCCL